MGAAGSGGAVNLGIAGADWGPNGGGLTYMGFRVGGSGDRGLELGLNPGLGVQVNGQGLYAGARADIGIRDGFSAGANARATFGEEDHGAVAEAHVLASGTTGSHSVSASSAALRQAEMALNKCKAVHSDCQSALYDATQKLVSARAEVEKKETSIKQKESELNDLRKEKEVAGVQKTETASLLIEAEFAQERQSLSLEEYKRKMLRAMRKDESSPMALALQTQVKSAGQLIAVLERNIKEYENRAEELENKMLRLQERLVIENKELTKLHGLMKSEELEVAKCSGEFHDAERQVNDAASKMRSFEGKRDAEKKRLQDVRR